MYLGTVEMKFVLLLFVLVIFINSGLCRHNSRRWNHTPKEASTFEYFTKPHGITIPVMIHLDKPLAYNLSREFRTRAKERAKHIFRNILKSSEILFRRPSLNQTVNFVLLDVKFLKNISKTVSMTSDVSKYLNSYCLWQGQKKLEKKKWYYSVLFTGLDVFYWKNNKQVRSSTGRGYLRGVCSMKNSCALLEWQRTNIALKLTHEIGHSLGISHDGAPYNKCQGGSHIMAAKYSPRNITKSWSPCSKRDLDLFLSSKFSWCLHSGSRNKF